MKHNKISLSEYINFSVVCLIFLPGINNFINTIFQVGFSIEIRTITPFVYIFMMLLGLGSYWLCLRYRVTFLLLALVMVIGTLISYIQYPVIRHVIYNNPVDLIYNDVNKLLFFCIPMLYLSYFIKDFENLFKDMIKWARINILLGLVAIIIIQFIRGKSLQYMVYSYFMLIPICVCFESYRNYRYKFDVLLSIIGVFAILITGARGTIISLGLYLFFRFFLPNKKNKNVRNFVSIIIAMMTLLLIFINFENILIFATRLLEQFNLSSRFLTSLLDSSLTLSIGRDLIRSAIITGLSYRPFFGYGLYGDRFITGTYGYNIYTYSHNIFLEILSYFGYLLGGLLIIIFIRQLYMLFRSEKDEYFSSVLFSILPYGLFQLFFTGSMLTNILFFMLCGFMLSHRNFTKKQSGVV